jgi:DNA-binding response OmpR family regulator
VSRFLKEFLSRAGHQVHSLQDPEGLEKILLNNNCDAVVLDIRLKDKNGIDLIPVIRKLLPVAPIVIFTGLGYRDEEMRRALSMGANGFVSKMLPPEELYAALIRAFMGHQPSV